TLLTLAVTAALLLVAGTAEAADKAAKQAKKKGNDVAAMFKKLDTNNDGKLSAAEFSKIELKKKKEGAAPAKANKKGNKKADALFSKLDANKDGSLSLDEFKKLNEAKKEK